MAIRQSMKQGNGKYCITEVTYEGWNFNSGNYLFTNDTKIDTCFEVLLSFSVVTSIVYNPLPAMWKS